MRTLATLILLCLTQQTFAQNLACGRPPPMRYQHEPTEPYTIHYVEPEDLRKHCNRGLWNYAPTPGACTLMDTREVFIPNDISGLRLRCVLIHEKAHLNGWAYNHPIR